MATTDLQDIIRRLDALEKAVFSTGTTTVLTSKVATNYSGPRGGARLLIDEGWFKSKHGLSDTRKELANRGYHYSRQAIHAALASLSKAGGPLVVLREQGENTYVERK